MWSSWKYIWILFKSSRKLNYIRKYDENQYNKEVYTKKAIEYIKRAKEIKEATEKKKKSIFW